MTAYYNDNDRTAAEWLGNLTAAGLLPHGAIDTRSIADVEPGDVAGATGVHFFAGIGGWPYALQLAGWPADRPVWTGSCPCQPFSNAGKRGGTEDARHLWPEMLRLIAECRPAAVFGEQVASRLGREWLAGVRADLESLGYAVGAADLCAPGVGAPHIRQRLYWGATLPGEGVDYPASARHERAEPGAEGEARDEAWLRVPGKRRPNGRLADAGSAGLARWQGERRNDGAELATAERDGNSFRWLADADSAGRSAGGPPAETMGYGRSTVPASWTGFRWHHCLDGKWRRIPAESGLFPLAYGLSGRVAVSRAGLVAEGEGTREINRAAALRGIGNAIVPPLAAAFVRAFMEATEENR